MSALAAGGAVRIALTTCPDAETAGRIVAALVDERLVACGTILPRATSIYRWRGEVETAAEAFVVLKTTTARLERLAERLTALHPYDVPELVVLAVGAGASDYLRWVVEETGGEV